MLLSSAIIAGGIAYASGDAVNACVNKKTGLTRIISGKMKCYKSERQVTWNQTGPTGSQGATGATGASGTSAIYYKIENQKDIAYNTPRTIITATLPAGKYSFQFSAEVAYFNKSISTTKTRYVACILSTSSNPTTALSSAATALWPIAGSADLLRVSFEANAGSTNRFGTQDFSQSGILDLTATTTMYLQCEHDSPEEVPASGQVITFHYPTFVATKVDSLSVAN